MIQSKAPFFICVMLAILKDEALLIRYNNVSLNFLIESQPCQSQYVIRLKLNFAELENF